MCSRYHPAASHRTAKIAEERRDPLALQCDQDARPAPRGCRCFERAAGGHVDRRQERPSSPSIGHRVVVASTNLVHFGVRGSRSAPAETILGPLHHQNWVEPVQEGIGLGRGRCLPPGLGRLGARVGRTVVESSRRHKFAKGFFVLLERTQSTFEVGELLLEGDAFGFDSLEPLLDFV